jgi:acetyl-CoA synthetase
MAAASHLQALTGRRGVFLGAVAGIGTVAGLGGQEARAILRDGVTAGERYARLSSRLSRISLQMPEREVLRGSLADGLNSCIECCDRMMTGASPWNESVAISFRRPSRLASLPSHPRVSPTCHIPTGRAWDVVAGLLPRIPKLFVAVLGCFRADSIYQPLFTTFAPARKSR